MSLYDQQYLDIAARILEQGYFDQNRTGIPTYKPVSYTHLTLPTIA